MFLVPTLFLSSNSMLTPKWLHAEWRIPVGCGFTGFFVEFMGLAAELNEQLPLLTLHTGRCDQSFFDHHVFKKEADALKHIYDRTDEQLSGSSIDTLARSWLHEEDLQRQNFQQLRKNSSSLKPFIPLYTYSIIIHGKCNPLLLEEERHKKGVLVREIVQRSRALQQEKRNTNRIEKIDVRVAVKTVGRFMTETALLSENKQEHVRLLQCCNLVDEVCMR
jgi:hypothetical protein